MSRCFHLPSLAALALTMTAPAPAFATNRTVGLFFRTGERPSSMRIYVDPDTRSYRANGRAKLCNMDGAGIHKGELFDPSPTLDANPYLAHPGQFVLECEYYDGDYLQRFFIDNGPGTDRCHFEVQIKNGKNGVIRVNLLPDSAEKYKRRFIANKNCLDLTASW